MTRRVANAITNNDFKKALVEARVSTLMDKRFSDPIREELFERENPASVATDWHYSR